MSNKKKTETQYKVLYRLDEAAEIAKKSPIELVDAATLGLVELCVQIPLNHRVHSVHPTKVELENSRHKRDQFLFNKSSGYRYTGRDKDQSDWRSSESTGEPSSKQNPEVESLKTSPILMGDIDGVVLCPKDCENFRQLGHTSQVFFKKGLILRDKTVAEEILPDHPDFAPENLDFHKYRVLAVYSRNSLILDSEWRAPPPADIEISSNTLRITGTELEKLVPLAGRHEPHSAYYNIKAKAILSTWKGSVNSLSSDLTVFVNETMRFSYEAAEKIRGEISQKDVIRTLIDIPSSQKISSKKKARWVAFFIAKKPVDLAHEHDRKVLEKQVRAIVNHADECWGEAKAGDSFPTNEKVALSLSMKHPDLFKDAELAIAAAHLMRPRWVDGKKRGGGGKSRM